MSQKHTIALALAVLACAAPAAHGQEAPAPEAPPDTPTPPAPAPRFTRWPAAVAPAEPAPEAHTFVVDRTARPRFTVAAIGRTAYVRDGAYRLFQNDDTSAGAGALVGYDVLSAARAALGLGLGFGSESLGDAGSPVFGGVTRADLDLLTFFAEARARFALLSWLQPHARVTAGATRGEMAINTTANTRLSGTAWAPSGSAGAGVTFRTPPIRFMSIDGHPAFAFSVAFEGGYAVGGPLTFDLTPERSVPAGGTAKDLIPTQGVTAGDLSRSFPYFSSTLALHF